MDLLNIIVACIQRNSYLLLSAMTAAICMISAWVYLLRKSYQSNDGYIDKDDTPKYSETDKQMDNEMTNDIDKLKVSEDMYQRIQRKVKSTRLQTTKTEKEMTLDERLLEQKTKEKQLQDIFELMNEKKEIFGIQSMEEMKSQLNLYDSSI